MTRAKPLPDPSVLQDLLSYEPDTGFLTWKPRPVEFFRDARIKTAEQIMRTWNSRYAGKPALAANSNGYRTGSIFGIAVNAHLVAFAMYYGRWPSQQIDHINGDKSDNRISNLREVSPRENSRNQPVGSKNTSGAIGVSWKSDKSKWRAYIAVDRRTKHLGYFDNLEDAVAARKFADNQVGFHQNHGRPSQGGFRAS